MRLFLHICCAPCWDVAMAGLHALHGPTLDVHGFFYNPNIHPLMEYRKRLKSVHVLNERLRRPLTVEGGYGLEGFLRDVWCDGAPERCGRCYAARLGVAARAAAQAGFTHLGTTLCVSAHQSHAAIREAGDAAAAAAGITFVYADLRPWLETTPRRPGLYRQQYCGCIFSEEERFRETPGGSCAFQEREQERG